jgi:RNA polymerase sigma factor (sigma-70 family)
MKAVKRYSDTELTAAIKNSTQLDDALLFIYQEYAETVSSFITNNGGSDQDADDVFQETVLAFVDIVQKDKFRGEASIKTFIVTIAKHTWYNEVKKKERSDLRGKAFEVSRGTMEEDVSVDISDREMKRELRELVYKLGEACRKILVLFYYENLPMKEIVQHLHYENEQVVRNKKSKCLKELTAMVKSNPVVAGQINNLIN